MPSIDFELPHWLYWAGLALFPLLAMVMARRGHTRGYSLPLAYLILLTGGVLGLHRFYLKNLWGLVYLPLFLGILYANAEGRAAREVQSAAANDVRVAERLVQRYEPRVEGADATISDLEAALAEARATEEEGSFAVLRAERALERERASVETARERLAGARTDLEAVRPAFERARANRRFWTDAALYLFAAIGVLLAIDALLLPRLKRAAEDRARDEIAAERAEAAAETEVAEGDLARVGAGWTGILDRLSYYAGEFVSYWAVIAVFVYYYEVLARYVFNSPTNWAHEGMFLMFGMQYLVAGAYAMLTESHVRVDIFYARWSPRVKALVDLLTSIFFFIFAGTILVTGWIFAMDATRVDEISFSEWAIAYWPFKWAIFVGGLLLVLQGVSKVAKDVGVLLRGGPPDPERPAGQATMREAG